MKKIVIYGAGAYGKILLCEMDNSNEHEVVAFTMDEKYISETEIMGVPVVPFETVQDTYPPDEYEMIVACGYSIMRNRKVMFDKAKSKGYKLANFISPRAIVERNVVMGENIVVSANSMVGHDCVLGDDVFLRGYVYLGHESVVGDHTVISTGASVSGFSKIGKLAYLGNGITGKDRVQYGDECLVGIGSNVVKDVPAYATCYGNPIKVAGYHKETGVVILEDKKNE